MNLPIIGMGTFGSDKYDEQTVANSVREAIRTGYRLFDCASVYGNESQIGQVLKEEMQAGSIKREDIIIFSKVWNDMHGEGQVTESCKQTLKDLQLEYLDVYFMHWPFPNYHAKGCSVDSRNKDSKPFFVKDFMCAWKQMEELKRQGLVKEIAMSNMTIPKFEEVLPLCEIMPYAHEMELHPSFQQKELFKYCKDKGMKVVAYCPLGSPNRPERDRTPSDVADTQMEEIIEIAKVHNCHPVEVCISWAVQRGQIPIPFTSRKENLIKNLNASTNIKLTDSEFERISMLDCDNRLVKGHVFLWEGANDWHDLWDENNCLEKWSFDKDKWIKNA